MVSRQIGGDRMLWPDLFFLPPEHFGERSVSDFGAGVVNPGLASNMLKHFLFVGIVEDMSISLDILDARLRGLGIRLGREGFLGRFRHQNRSHRRNLAWLCQEDEIGRRVLACNASDRLLYSEFRKRLWASHCEMLSGQDFKYRFCPYEIANNLY